MIVVGGEALIDLVPAPSTPDGELGALLPLPGGGPYNVAVAASRLGARVGFWSRLSTDHFGTALLNRLVLNQVNTELVQRGTEPTTLAVAGIGPDGAARYSFHVEGTAERLVADPGDLGDEVSTLSLGTLSLLLEPGASVYEAMLRRHAGRGGLTVVDPNIRPALVADPPAYRARFSSWLPHIGLLKLSVEDAAWLAGLPPATPEHHVVAAVRTWLGQGPAAAVLTRGPAGLAAITGGGALVEVEAVGVPVVDTIGAGDTVHGALLYWLDGAGVRTAQGVRELTERSWREALDLAARAAAVTVSRAGAEPPYLVELTN